MPYALDQVTACILTIFAKKAYVILTLEGVFVNREEAAVLALKETVDSVFASATASAPTPTTSAWRVFATHVPGHV
jgi:hypothetical protein